jgi:hypothetical protein
MNHILSTMHRILSRFLVLCIGIVIAASVARAQSGNVNVRVCTYNLTPYHFSDPFERIEALRRIILAVRPTILVVQGFNGAENPDHFRVFAMAGMSRYHLYFTNVGSVTSDAVFGDSTVLSPLGTVRGAEFSTTERPLDIWGLGLDRNARPTPTQWLSVMSLAMVEGTDSAAIASRAIDAGYVRRATNEAVLDGEKLIVLAGSLGMLGTNEEGYRILVNKEGEGIPLFDPIADTGTWHDNPAFAAVHTNSTRAIDGDSLNDGLTDRYDMMLFSENLRSRYVPGSYTVFGNDAAHFGRAVDALPNLVVSDSLARDLKLASDHLPVYADFVFTVTSGVDRDAATNGKLVVSPQPARGHVTLASPRLGGADLRVRFYDPVGALVLDQHREATSDGLVVVDTRGLASGVYHYEVAAESEVFRGRVVVVR